MVNPFQPISFYMKCNSGLKWVNLFIADVPKDPIEEKIKLNVFQFVEHEMIFRKISVEVSFYSYSLLICNITETKFQCGYSPINFPNGLHVYVRYKNKFENLMVYIIYLTLNCVTGH